MDACRKEEHAGRKLTEQEMYLGALIFDSPVDMNPAEDDFADTDANQEDLSGMGDSIGADSSQENSANADADSTQEDLAGAEPAQEDPSRTNPQETAEDKAKGPVVRPMTEKEIERELRWQVYARAEEKRIYKAHRRKIWLMVALAALAFVCIICAAVAAAIGAGVWDASADTISNSSSSRYMLDLDLSMPYSTSDGADRNYYVYLYGPDATSSSQTSVIESGTVFSFAPTVLEIIIPQGKLVTQYASVKAYGRVYDFSLTGPVSVSNSYVYEGSTMEETSVTYNFSGLTDGIYTLQFTKDEYNYTSTSVGGKTESYVDEVTVTFQFTVDTTGPVITGAYKDEDSPLYTKTDFTVTATDALSGITSLGYKTPSSTTMIWSSSSSSKTFTISGNGEGMYSFCAKDGAGNTSGYYYTYLDATAPVITASGADLGGVTDSSFRVTATDASGTATLYYRKADSGSWISVSGGTVTITDTSGDGEYQFYAADAAGNTSVTYSVSLSTEEIEGFFVTNNSDNSQAFYWSNTNWTAALDGEAYERGTWITDEGDHEIILTSKYGDTLTYSCTIDHYYVKAQTVAATCSEQGYTLYECTHCGDTYKADLTAMTKHDYRATYTLPTCTEQGYMTYTCADCGYSYTDGYTPANSHYYTKTTVEPTCNEEGYCLYECIVCHDTYTTDYIT